jgi:hypothetical protein
MVCNGLFHQDTATREGVAFQLQERDLKIAAIVHVVIILTEIQNQEEGWRLNLAHLWTSHGPLTQERHVTVNLIFC